MSLHQFTRALTRTRARLIAVEPVPEMLALLRDALLDVGYAPA